MGKRFINKELCEQIITPSIIRSGWCRESQISFCEDANFAYNRLNTDYVLYYQPNIPIAVITIIEQDTEMNLGIEIAINNAKLLDIPCAFCSNSSYFLFYDLTKLPEYAKVYISIDKFPTPDELWQIYINYKTTYAITSKIKLETNKGFSRLLVGLLNIGASLMSIIFKVLDNLFSASTNKRILYLTDNEDYFKNRNDNYYQRTDNWSHIQKDDWLPPFNNRPYPETIKNVWINNNGNISVYHTLMNEFARFNDIQTYKQYPPDFFDMVLLDYHKNKVIECESYRDMLNYFTETHQIAIRSHNSITKFDIEYFGVPYLIDTIFFSTQLDRDEYGKTYISKFDCNAYQEKNQDTIYNNNIDRIECTNKNKTFKLKNIINTNKIINTTIMARQNSFEYQIELAEDLKAYLIRLQENLTHTAQKYQDKVNNLYEAEMVDEKHQKIEEYMHETVSRIKSLVEQINELEIPFVDSWINYLEEGQSIK